MFLSQLLPWVFVHLPAHDALNQWLCQLEVRSYNLVTFIFFKSCFTLMWFLSVLIELCKELISLHITCRIQSTFAFLFCVWRFGTLSWRGVRRTGHTRVCGNMDRRTYWRRLARTLEPTGEGMVLSRGERRCELQRQRASCCLHRDM